MHTTYSAEVAKAILKMQAVTIPIQEEPKAQNDLDTGQPIALTSWDKHPTMNRWRNSKSTRTAFLRRIYISTISVRRTLRMILRRPSFPADRINQRPNRVTQVNPRLVLFLRLEDSECYGYGSVSEEIVYFFQRDGMGCVSFLEGTVSYERHDKPLFYNACNIYFY